MSEIQQIVTLHGLKYLKLSERLFLISRGLGDHDVILTFLQNTKTLVSFCQSLLKLGVKAVKLKLLCSIQHIITSLFKSLSSKMGFLEVFGIYFSSE